MGSMNSPVAPGVALETFVLNPAAHAKLALENFDLVVFALFVGASSTAAGGSLYTYS